MNMWTLYDYRIFDTRGKRGKKKKVDSWRVAAVL